MLEAPGIDPGTSRMLSERSTIWATPPSTGKSVLALLFQTRFEGEQVEESCSGAALQSQILLAGARLDNCHTTQFIFKRMF